MPRDISLVRNARGEFMLCLVVEPHEASDDQKKRPRDPVVNVEGDRIEVVRGGALPPLAAPRPHGGMLSAMVQAGRVLVAEIAEDGTPFSAYPADARSSAEV